MYSDLVSFLSLTLFHSTSTGSPSSSLTDLVVTIQGFTSVPIDVIYDHYLQLISISVAFTALFSFYL